MQHDGQDMQEPGPDQGPLGALQVRISQFFTHKSIRIGNVWLKTNVLSAKRIKFDI